MVFPGRNNPGDGTCVLITGKKFVDLKQTA